MTLSVQLTDVMWSRGDRRSHNLDGVSVNFMSSQYIDARKKEEEKKKKKRKTKPFLSSQLTPMHGALSVEGCLIVIAACVPMLYPVCDSLQAWLRRAIKREKARRPNNDQPPAARQKAHEGFWTRKLRLALDGKEGRSDSTGRAVSEAEEPSTYNCSGAITEEKERERGVAEPTRAAESSKDYWEPLAGVSARASTTI